MTLEAVQIGRSAEDRTLLRDVSLSVAPGVQRALVGPSGSGKTLLLRALAMLDPVDAGEIRWRGTVVKGNQVPSFRARVIYLHQRPALTEGTVETNLRRPFELRVHRDKRFDRPRMIARLESLGRSERFLSQHERDLSGGEAQLTALLRAIQLDPDVLLLDEPTAALDREATEMVETLVGQWISQQPSSRATVWVTHDRDQARRVSTSLVAIRDGRLQEDG